MTHPDLAAQWHPTRNKDMTPAAVTHGSRREVWWRCPVAKSHDWHARIAARTSMLSGCPTCALRAGKGGRRAKPLRRIGSASHS